MRTSEKNFPGRFLLLWTLTTAIGWGVSQYGGFSLRDEVLKSASQIPPLVWVLCWRGAILGGLVGILQWLALNYYKKNTGLWFLVAITAHSIGAGLGLIAAVSLIWLFARSNGVELLSGQDSSWSMSYPLAISMIFSGAFISLLQWFVVRRFLPSPNISKAMIWIAGTVIAWGLGFWAAGYIYGAGLLAQNIAAGSVIGVVTGALLIVVLSSGPSHETPLSANRLAR